MCARTTLCGALLFVFLQSLSLPVQLYIFFLYGLILHPMYEISHLGIPK